MGPSKGIPDRSLADSGDYLKFRIIQMQRFTAVSVKNNFHGMLPGHLLNIPSAEEWMLHSLARNQF